MLQPHLPEPRFAQVFLDFDGTISQKDVLDELIFSHARNESWKLIEERWQAGLIGSRECLEQEFALIQITSPRLNAFLDKVKLDPGIHALLGLLESLKIPVSILSDGIDRFIGRILANHGITNLPVRSNTITHRGSRITLECPHASEACQSAAAHCKCASAGELAVAGRQVIYVGDGRSDLCPARKAAVVFAKATLAKNLQAEKIPFVHFSTLQDVAATLSEAWLSKAKVV